MAPLGIAVIGAGLFIKEAHLPAIHEHSDLISLKAIYSRSLASAQDVSNDFGSKESIPLYAEDAGDAQSLDALLARKDIAAVIIALPIPAQPTYIKRALQSGKHVLSEKPIAKDLATAKELIEWYKANIDTSKVFWSVAENFRFLERFRYGRKQIEGLGRVLGFRLRKQSLVEPGAKYYETAWRKTPEHQGGFLLDGGVHYIAGMRLLLGSESKMTRLSCFSAQLQKHLPPVDTVDATVRLANGVSGIIAISFGTTGSGVEYLVACEHGTVDVGFDKTIVRRGKEEHVEQFPNDGNGVTAEVKAWAEGIVQGKANPMQSPEQGLADLEILEAMLRSGESDGTPVALELQ